MHSQHLPFKSQEYVHGQSAKLILMLGHSLIKDSPYSQPANIASHQCLTVFNARFRKAQKIHLSLRPEENCLKILVVYDTTSVKRNTEKVAMTMSEVLKAKGFDVDCVYVKDIDLANVKNYDCVLAGSPTQAFRATGPIMQFLDRFAKNEFAGKTAAAFDTQLQSRMSGNAAKGIEKKLEKLGFKIVMPPLVTYVEGKMNEVHLKDGELEKAKKYAEDLASKLHQ